MSDEKKFSLSTEIEPSLQKAMIVVAIITTILWLATLLKVPEILPVTWLSKMYSKFPCDGWGYFLSIYLTVAWVANISIILIRTCLLNLFKIPAKSNDASGNVTEASYEEGSWPPTVVGYLESILYPISLVIGKAEFIGLWIAIKVAAGFSDWNKSGGRKLFQLFLIGNALSIIFGFVTYVLWKAFVFLP